MNESKNVQRTGGAHPERRPNRRSRRAAKAREGWNLRFESAGTAVPAALVQDSPTLLVAAIEDVCWQVAAESWRARRPHRWHRRAYDAWRAQSAWLDAKRERLASMVDDALATNL
jgi:hypothetical protein